VVVLARIAGVVDQSLNRPVLERQFGCGQVSPRQKKAARTDEVAGREGSYRRSNEKVEDNLSFSAPDQCGDRDASGIPSAARRASGVFATFERLGYNFPAPISDRRACRAMRAVAAGTRLRQFNNNC